MSTPTQALDVDAPIPRLRDGVAIHGGAALVDDLQRMRVTQPGEVIEAVSLFDGVSSARIVSQVLAARGIGIPEDVIAAIAMDLDASFFLDSSRGRARAARLGAAPAEPAARPDSETKPGDLLFLPGARFTCNGAGDCCEYWQIGPLAGPDLERLAAHDWTTIVPGLERSSDVVVRPEELDEKPHLRWVDHHCVFLDENKRCRVHATRGATVKPALCQLFPYQLVRRPDGRVNVSLRFHCQCVGESVASGAPCELEAASLVEIMRVRRQEARRPPSIVRVAQGCCVPFATAFAIDERALEAVEAAGGGDAGLHAALRVVGEAIERLGRLPDLERIDALDRWLSGLDVRALLATPRPSYDPRAAISAFGAVLLAVQDGVTKEFVWRQPLVELERAQLEHRRRVVFALHMLCARFGDRFGAKLGMPPHDHEAAAAIDPALDDPAVHAVATAFLRNAIFGKDWSYQLDYGSGYGTMATRYVLGRWLAKIHTFERGAERTSAADLTRGLVEINRLGNASWLMHVLQTIGTELGALVAMPFPFECGLV